MCITVSFTHQFLRPVFLLGLFLFLLPAKAQQTYPWHATLTAPYLVYPAGIAMDAEGHLYVADASSLHNDVQKFRPDGTRLLRFGGAGILPVRNTDGPAGVAVDKNGNVFVVSMVNKSVLKFSPQGIFLAQIGGPGTGNGKFDTPVGVAADRDNNLYVTDAVGAKVQKFTNEGVFLSVFGSWGTGTGQFKKPYGITVDGENNVYVVDQENDRVQKFSPKGEFLVAFGSPIDKGGQFLSPQYIAVDAKGDIYVTDESSFGGMAGIHKFSTNGTFLAGFGVYGEADGQTNRVRGIVIDKDNNLLVSDLGNHRIQKFSGSGAFLGKFGDNYTGRAQLVLPRAVEIAPNGDVLVHSSSGLKRFSNNGALLGYFGEQKDGSRPGIAEVFTFDARGNLYHAQTGQFQNVEKFSPDGALLGTFCKLDVGRFNYTTPGGIAFDHLGNLFVVDQGHDRVLKFDSTGTFLLEFGAQGTGDAQFDGPDGIAIDKQGNLYITDTGNNRIQKFSGNGTFLMQFGSPGSKDGAFNAPAGITFDSHENLLVCDEYNNRMQLFTKEGKYLTKFGTPGSQSGQLHAPIDVAADQQGKVFVADRFNHRVQVFVADAAEQAPKLAQTITFAPIADQSEKDVPVQLSATASSGLPVSFSIVAGPAQLSGNTLSLTGVGRVTVRASQAGNDAYNPAPDADQSFTVQAVTALAPGLTGLVQLSPNPASDFLVIHNIPPFPGTTVTLSSALGQETFMRRMGEGEVNLRIALHGYAKGLYVVKISSKRATIVKRIVLL